MPDNFNITETLSSLFEKLEEFIKTETVVGEPIKIGDVTIVPFIDISFGLGTGGGSGTEEKGNQGTGSGAGSGGRVSPTAVLVIKGEHVELLPISKTASLEKLINIVPDLVEKFKDNKTETKEDKKED